MGAKLPLYADLPVSYLWESISGNLKPPAKQELIFLDFKVMFLVLMDATVLPSLGVFFCFCFSPKKLGKDKDGVQWSHKHHVRYLVNDRNCCWFFREGLDEIWTLFHSTKGQVLLSIHHVHLLKLHLALLNISSMIVYMYIYIYLYSLYTYSFSKKSHLFRKKKKTAHLFPA